MKASTEIMNIAGLVVEVRRKKIKNLRLAVHPPEGKVTFSVPYAVGKRDVQRFLEQRIDWIHIQQQQIKLQPRVAKPQYKTGSTIYIWGRAHTLQLVPSPGRARFECEQGRDVYLFVAADADAIYKEKIIQQWYRQQLKLIIPELLQKWQPIVGKHAQDWGIKKMKTRWGSCNIHAKRIWLNLDLAMWPLSCLEYVIVHELTHLHERYHNARFKHLLDQFFPGWREQEKMLKGQLSEC